MTFPLAWERCLPNNIIIIMFHFLLLWFNKLLCNQNVKLQKFLTYETMIKKIYTILHILIKLEVYKIIR